MNAKTKTGLQILEAAVLLGVLGDALLRATPWGLNVLLWIVALVAVMSALTLRRKRELWSRESIALHAALVVFAGFVAWRDSLTLQTLDILILLTILSVLSLPALDIKPHLTGFLRYFIGAFSSVMNAMVAPLMLVFGDIDWKGVPHNGWTKHLAAILRGLAIAGPIVLIFGALFIAADAVFEGIVKDTLNIRPEIIFGHALLFSILTWICAGYLRGALFGSLLNNKWTTVSTPSKTLNLSEPASSVVHDSTENKVDAPTQASTYTDEQFERSSLVPEFLRLGAIEVGTILGLVNLLFLSFVAVQLRYFFGGIDLVQTTENFKLAEYARRGFFELCWVAGLMLPVLLTMHFLLRKDKAVAEKLFRVLAAMNIGLLFVIMYSAVSRMLLYSGALGYGLTEMRFYPMAVMLWLALVFVWFGLTVLRNQPQRFAWGALWTALFVVASLHAVNPDDFIVRHNIKLLQQGRSFDMYYVQNLSDDATPALLEAAPEMTIDQQCVLKGKFKFSLRDESFSEDFRSWNFARWKARQILLREEHGLQNIVCQTPYSQSHAVTTTATSSK